MQGLPCSMLLKQVREVMSTPVVVAREDTRLIDAIKEMYRSNVGSIVVVREDGGIVGVVTRKDLVYLVANEVLAKNPKLREVMSTSIVTASQHDSIIDVLKRMIEVGVRHIPIIEGNKVVGIVSLTDIARYLAETLVSTCAGQGNL